MRYRDHRGSLKRSLETTIEVHSEQDIIDHLNDIHPSYAITSIKFEYSCYDERTGWDTFYILAKNKNGQGSHVAGMSDGNTFNV